MSEWKKSNYASWSVYRSLVVHKELEPTLVSFAEAEKYKMPGLSFYVLGASSDDLKTRAELTAMELYNFIVINYLPEWEDRDTINSTRAAIDKLVEILINKDKSIFDLSAVVDDIFKFSNE